MRNVLILGIVAVAFYFVSPMVFSNEVSIDGYKIKATFPDTPQQKRTKRCLRD